MVVPTPWLELGKLIRPRESWYSWSEPLTSIPDNYYNIQDSIEAKDKCLANYKINDQFEPHAEVFYTKSDVDLQPASTGSFATTFDVPIGNPFIPKRCAIKFVLVEVSPLNCVSGNSTIVPMLVDRRFTELGPLLTRTQPHCFNTQLVVEAN